MEFNLGIDNDMQKFLLFINPLSSALFFLGIALFFKGRKSQWILIVIEFLLSFLLYANVVYYRFFNDFITLPDLQQTDNFGDLGGSALALMKWTDIFYFLDTVILIALAILLKIKPQPRVNKRAAASVYVLALMVFAVNLSLAQSDRPQLLTRTFDRNYLVKYLGAYNFTIYDIITSIRSSTQRAFADSSDLT